MCTKQLKDVTDVDALVSFLKTKGENHKCYYHYTSWDSFLKIYENASFLLTRGNSLNINDQHEALMKGSWSTWNRTYIGSFAYGQSKIWLCGGYTDSLKRMPSELLYPGPKC